MNNVKEELQLGPNDSFKCDCFYGCYAIKFDMAFQQRQYMVNRQLLSERVLVWEIHSFCIYTIREAIIEDLTKKNSLALPNSYLACDFTSTTGLINHFR